MSQINVIIPQQSFELVRDRLGEILTSEIATQLYLTGSSIFPNKVWKERFIPFDFTELPAICVSAVSGTYDNQDVAQVDGTYLYNIDCYIKSKHTETEDADTEAMVKLHRLISVCRAIIMNPKFKTLGFEPPFVMNRNITSMAVADPGKQDATNSVMGRLVVSVRVVEDTELITPRLLYGFDTTVRLYSGNNGYLWSRNHPGDGFDYVFNFNL